MQGATSGLFDDCWQVVFSHLSNLNHGLEIYTSPAVKMQHLRQFSCITRRQSAFRKSVRHVRILCPRLSYPTCNNQFEDYVDICGSFENLHSVQLCMDVDLTSWGKPRYFISASGRALGFYDDSEYVRNTIELLTRPSPSNSGSAKSPLSILQQLQEHCVSLQVLIRDVAPRRQDEMELDNEQFKWVREEDITSFFTHSAAMGRTTSTDYEAVKAYCRDRSGFKIRREDGTSQLSYLMRLQAGFSLKRDLEHEASRAV